MAWLLLQLLASSVITYSIRTSKGQHPAYHTNNCMYHIIHTLSTQVLDGGKKLFANQNLIILLDWSVISWKCNGIMRPFGPSGLLPQTLSISRKDKVPIKAFHISSSRRQPLSFLLSWKCVLKFYNAGFRFSHCKRP